MTSTIFVALCRNCPEVFESTDSHERIAWGRAHEQTGHVVGYLARGGRG